MAKGFKYCVLHSLASFIVIHLVQDTESGRPQARISDVIPLTSPATPIMPLVLDLVLHSRQDELALEYLPMESTVATSNDPSPEQNQDLHPESSTHGPHEPTEDVGSSNHPTGGQTLPPSPLALSEYWEPKEVSEATLATMLRTASQLIGPPLLVLLSYPFLKSQTNGLSLCWEMKPYSRKVYRPVRHDDSSLWADPLPRKAIPYLIPHSQNYNHVTPPHLSSMTPFVLQLDSKVCYDDIGTRYQGHFRSLFLPITVKILPTYRMEPELKIWRKLRNLAGIEIPGLFGAYSIDEQEGRQDTGALVQQHAGAPLESFDGLSHEQR